MNFKDPNEHLVSRRSFLTGFAVAGASSLLLPRVTGIALAAEPTLEETLKWIQTKLNDSFDITDDGKPARYTLNVGYDLDKYTITLSPSKEYTKIESGQISEDSRIYVVPLSKLKLVILPDNNLITLQTKEDKKAINVKRTTKWFRHEEVANEEAWLSFAEIYTRDPDQATRVTKAFNHVISLSADKIPNKPTNEPF